MFFKHLLKENALETLLHQLLELQKKLSTMKDDGSNEMLRMATNNLINVFKNRHPVDLYAIESAIFLDRCIDTRRFSLLKTLLILAGKSNDGASLLQDVARRSRLSNFVNVEILQMLSEQSLISYKTKQILIYIASITTIAALAYLAYEQFKNNNKAEKPSLKP